MTIVTIDPFPVPGSTMLIPFADIFRPYLCEKTFRNSGGNDNPYPFFDCLQCSFAGTRVILGVPSSQPVRPK